MTSVLTKGTSCLYRTRQGDEVTVTVVKVHYDDARPYYTIDLDGTERATVRDRLRLVGEAAGGGGGGGVRLEPEDMEVDEPGGNPLDVVRDPSARSSAALLRLAEASPDAAALFKAIDTDGDGAITTRDLARYFQGADNANDLVAKLFRALDVDDDGLIDTAEFAAAHKWARETQRGLRIFFDAGPADALFTAIDKDQDAAITRRELQRYLAKLGTPEEVCAAEASRLFKAIDRDDDGLIDRKEFKAAHRRIACLPHSMA
jgi:Ca2+-binding EF-hand superfamily protein